MAMARVSVEVPSELVGPVRGTVLLLYQATAESLQLALRAHSEAAARRRRWTAPGTASSARRAGRSLGWEAGPGTRQLSAPAELLHDAFYGALIDAGERLAVTASRTWRGELPLERVQGAAAEVLALDRLLRLLESLSPRP
jgi:hypothetical protein